MARKQRPDAQRAQEKLNNAHSIQGRTAAQVGEDTRTVAEWERELAAHYVCLREPRAEVRRQALLALAGKAYTEQTLLQAIEKEVNAAPKAPGAMGKSAIYDSLLNVHKRPSEDSLKNLSKVLNLNQAQDRQLWDLMGRYQPDESCKARRKKEMADAKAGREIEGPVAGRRAYLEQAKSQDWLRELSWEKTAEALLLSVGTMNNLKENVKPVQPSTLFRLLITLEDGGDAAAQYHYFDYHPLPEGELDGVMRVSRRAYGKYGMDSKRSDLKRAAALIANHREFWALLQVMLAYFDRKEYKNLRPALFARAEDVTYEVTLEEYGLVYMKK